MHRIPFLFSVLSALAFFGPQAAGQDKPLVHAANYPLAYFAERIGGDLIEVAFLAPDGDPAFWKPTASDIGKMQGADLLLLNGADYSKWLRTASLPSAIQVSTSASFSGSYIAIEGGRTHSHGDGDTHSHDGIAFTTWMDFQQAEKQAKAVRDALIETLPDEKKQISDNFSALAKEIDELHKGFKKAGRAVSKEKFVGSHPVYQYFARAYKIDMVSVHWEPEVVPGQKSVTELTNILAKHPAKWMIWEGEPAAASVQMLKDKGIQSVVIDPCGNRPDAGDWLSVMRQNLANLQAVAGG